jgi:predicted DNA-binding protein
MKTIAVRLEDNVSELLGLVSQLEGTTIVDQIREAIDTHLARKVAEGDLAERASAALDDIDREAKAKKDAIGALFEQTAKVITEPKTPRRRPQKAEQPSMGFAPGSGSKTVRSDQ